MESSIAEFLARQSASEQLPRICVSLRFIFRLPRMPSRSTDVSAQGKELEGSAQTRTSKKDQWISASGVGLWELSESQYFQNGPLTSLPRAWGLGAQQHPELSKRAFGCSCWGVAFGGSATPKLCDHSVLQSPSDFVQASPPRNPFLWRSAAPWVVGDVATRQHASPRALVLALADRRSKHDILD